MLTKRSNGTGEDEHWRAAKTWSERIKSVRVLLALVAALFIGGYVASTQIGAYAKTADLAPGHQVTAAKLENHEGRLVTLEVGVAKDIDWIKATLKAMAQRDGWVPPPETK